MASMPGSFPPDGAASEPRADLASTPPTTPDAPPIPDLQAQPRGVDGGESGVGGGFRRLARMSMGITTITRTPPPSISGERSHRPTVFHDRLDVSIPVTMQPIPAKAAMLAMPTQRFGDFRAFMVILWCRNNTHRRWRLLLRRTGRQAHRSTFGGRSSNRRASTLPCSC